jgi:hypothetical protein
MSFKGADAMIGEPIETAFNVIGYPDKKEQFGADTVYFWNRENDLYFANFRFVTGPDGKIKTWSSLGNEGGYAYFSTALSQYAKQKKRPAP